jgi:hypothetical protein
VNRFKHLGEDESKSLDIMDFGEDFKYKYIDI